MSNDEFKVLSSDLGEETKRPYEVKLTALANSIAAEKRESELRDFIESDTDDNSSYAAFYCLNIIYRRRKDYLQLKNLFDRYKQKFEQHPTFNHLNILMMLEIGAISDSPNLLNDAYKDRIAHDKNAGMVHLFADVVATYFEDNEVKKGSYEYIQWFDKAVDAIEVTLQLDPNYAKYYCTKARLLAFDEQYKDSVALLKRAIALEDSSKDNYALRVNNYQNYLTTVQIKRQTAQMKKEFDTNIKIFEQKQADVDRLIEENLKQSQESIEKSTKETQEQIDGSLLKNMEFIGLFSGVVSFTIGSIQILNNQEFSEAAKLIIVLMGCLLFAFSGFSFVIGKLDKNKLTRCLIMFATGILTILGGLLI